MGATVFVQPLDLVKNRMQMSGKQSLILYTVLLISGITAFCHGGAPPWLGDHG